MTSCRSFLGRLACLLLPALLWAGPALAQDSGDDPAFVTVGVGYFDAIEAEEEAIDFRLEYRHNEKLWIFKPWAGVEGTSDGAIYGLAGVLVDLYFGKRIVVTPSFGAGLYHDGDGKDLGGLIEFRSQLEVAYRFNDRSRLGVAIGHISNAGLGDDNPGTEIVTVYYSAPLRNIFR